MLTSRRCCLLKFLLPCSMIPDEFPMQIYRHSTDNWLEIQGKQRGGSSGTDYSVTDITVFRGKCMCAACQDSEFKFVLGYRSADSACLPYLSSPAACIRSPCPGWHFSRLYSFLYQGFMKERKSKKTIMLLLKYLLYKQLLPYSQRDLMIVASHPLSPRLPSQPVQVMRKEASTNVSSEW